MSMIILALTVLMFCAAICLHVSALNLFRAVHSHGFWEFSKYRDCCYRVRERREENP